MVMSISNYSGTASTFTFPNNPNTFDDAVSSNYTITSIAYHRHHVFVSGGGVSPKSIVLTGHFFGTTKNTSYNTLSGHFMENYKLKKLYFETTKFYLGFGKAIKKTHTGGKTNFLDYVATFETVFGILFSNTQKTTGTNEGNVTTFIEEITGQYDGAGDVVIADGLSNTITIKSAKFAGKTYFKYELVKMVSSGGEIYNTDFGVFSVSATADGTYTEVSNSTTGLIKLEAAANITTVSVSNTTGTLTKKFRDGFSS